MNDIDIVERALSYRTRDSLIEATDFITAGFVLDLIQQNRDMAAETSKPAIVFFPSGSLGEEVTA